MELPGIEPGSYALHYSAFYVCAVRIVHRGVLSRTAYFTPLYVSSLVTHETGEGCVLFFQIPLQSGIGPPSLKR